MLEVSRCLQSNLINPHTLVPGKEIIQINETFRLLNCTFVINRDISLYNILPSNQLSHVFNLVLNYCIGHLYKYI